VNDVECPRCKGDTRLLHGVIQSDIYGGVLFWVCLHCTHAFPRDFGVWKNRQEVSNDAAADFNRRTAASGYLQPTGEPNEQDGMG